MIPEKAAAVPIPMIEKTSIRQRQIVSVELELPREFTHRLRRGPPSDLWQGRRVDQRRDDSVTLEAVGGGFLLAGLIAKVIR